MDCKIKFCTKYHEEHLPSNLQPSDVFNKDLLNFFSLLLHYECLPGSTSYFSLLAPISKSECAVSQSFSRKLEKRPTRDH